MPREKTWENERLTHQLLSHYQADAEIDPVCFGQNLDFSCSDQKKKKKKIPVYTKPFAKVVSVTPIHRQATLRGSAS